MRKTFFIILWAFLSFVVAFTIWSLICSAWKPHEAVFWTPQQSQQWQHLWSYGQIILLGFPVVAVVLGFFGILPGTRSKKANRYLTCRLTALELMPGAYGETLSVTQIQLDSRLYWGLLRLISF